MHLGVRAERFEKNNAYEVELTMEIPGKLFVGKEASHTIEKALDLSKDRLVAQLRKHEDLLKSRGKSASGLKRFIKEISEERVAGGLTEATYDSALSSELGSNPIHTL